MDSDWDEIKYLPENSFDNKEKLDIIKVK